MGFTRSYEVRSNGKISVAQLVDCVNVNRTPQVREQILLGTFHRVRDPDNPEKWITVEKPFGYMDVNRRQFYLVRPRNERHNFRSANRQLMRMVSVLPAAYREGARFRLVFGLAELREKLFAHDADLYDRHLELIKAIAIYQHPFLFQRPRLRLLLAGRTNDELILHGAYDHSPHRYELRVPYDMIGRVLAKEKELKKSFAKAHKHNVIDPKDKLKWVNISRWVPGLSGLEQLHATVLALGKGAAPGPTGAGFRGMLKTLPHGSQLPPWAKRDLDVLFNWAVNVADSTLQANLFEIRFGRDLEDDWALNDDPKDIDTLYKILRALPESHVEGNVALREITLDAGGDGAYDPNTRDISIGEEALASQEGFEDMFRHEIGHAVHEANEKRVNAWLRDRFGWQMFDVWHDGEIDKWVDLLGGYGAVSAIQKAQIREFIRKAVGEGSSWDPPATAVAPGGHPWNRPDFKPRLALQSTGSNWYRNNQAWLSHNHRRFAANFWYATLMVVADETLSYVNASMPDDYAAMSPLEFFAELYALYFDLDEPKRKHIPKDIIEWMSTSIGKAKSVRGKFTAGETKSMKAVGQTRKPGANRRTRR